MIITLTPNPSTDVTMHVAGPLTAGGVNRAESVTAVAGGKGVNVSRAAHLAHTPTTAIFPAGDQDPFLARVADTGVPYEAVPINDRVRMNTTITARDGHTTKINGPGPTLSSAELHQLQSALQTRAAGAAACVMAGSLPQGVSPDFYAGMVQQIRSAHPGILVAVDTSDAAMQALGDGFPAAAPHLIKPNGLELGQLVGTDGLALEQSAAEDDFAPVVEAALSVVARGVEQVLVTLGAAGALLATAEGVWRATPAPVTVRSTVGAGDSSLAGYILAALAGETYPERLRRAVAYGTAATGLPGTVIPSPEHLDVPGTDVFPISP